MLDKQLRMELKDLESKQKNREIELFIQQRCFFQNKLFDKNNELR